MMVKICGITNREDAKAAADAGAGAIGLNFYRQSPRYVSPTGAAIIAGSVPSRVLKIGVFVDEPADIVAHVALKVGLDAVQLHGATEHPGVPVWRARSVNDVLDRVWFEDELAEAFLLDTAAPNLRGGTGQRFEWKIARDARNFTTKHIIIAGGLDETNVETAIHEADPWGVDVCSRIESSPGKKDHQKLRRFIEAALSA
jgi:phosphoribosylanthranilate isomerase